MFVEDFELLSRFHAELMNVMALRFIESMTVTILHGGLHKCG